MEMKWHFCHFENIALRWLQADENKWKKGETCKRTKIFAATGSANGERKKNFNKMTKMQKRSNWIFRIKTAGKLHLLFGWCTLKESRAFVSKLFMGLFNSIFLPSQKLSCFLFLRRLPKKKIFFHQAETRGKKISKKIPQTTTTTL